MKLRSSVRQRVWRAPNWPVALAALTLEAAGADSIELRALEGLRFDRLRAAVTPGTTVTVHFQNADATDQPHNFLIVKPGRLKEVLDAALALGVEGPARDYVPGAGDVLVASRLLKAGERQDVVFAVPKEPAVYPFVCTFPGHGMLMFGAFYAAVPMPAEMNDPNIPKAVVATGPPITPDPRPMVRRIFMPDAGPAAIAVALPGGQNFCWDAGACRLRYAWKGGFVEATKHFRSKGQPLATLLGERWWTAPAEFPLEPGGTPPSRVRFRGYVLNAGIPTFEYDLDGQLVRETIDSLTDGGLRRVFDLPGMGRILTVVPGEAAGVRVTASVGSHEAGTLRLSPEEARRFELRYRPAPFPP
jgi:azurin